MRRRFWEKGDEDSDWLGWASTTGGGVGGGFTLSKARACGASEANKRVAKVALDGRELKGFELGSLLRMCLVMRSFLLEKREKGIGTGLVVFGVGILVP